MGGDQTLALKKTRHRIAQRSCAREREELEGVPSHRERWLTIFPIYAEQCAFRSKGKAFVSKSKMKTQQDTVNYSTRYSSSDARARDNSLKFVRSFERKWTIRPFCQSGHRSFACNPSHIIIRKTFRQPGDVKAFDRSTRLSRSEAINVRSNFSRTRDLLCSRYLYREPLTCDSFSNWPCRVTARPDARSNLYRRDSRAEPPSTAAFIQPAGNGNGSLKASSLTSCAVLESGHALHCKWQSNRSGAMSDRTRRYPRKRLKAERRRGENRAWLPATFPPQLFPSASAMQMRPIERPSQLPVALAGLDHKRRRLIINI